MQNEINEFTKEILRTIYEEVYKKINEKQVDVFLCGGARNRKNKSLRDLVKDSLINENKKNLRILYPEDMFIEILNKNKNQDLLTLESFLADNCDVICIICESPGALVELGAFTNNEATFEKVIALVDKKHKKDKSFIMLGPIKYIKKHNRNNVIFYDKENVNELIKILNRTFNRKRLAKIIKERDNNNKQMNTIIGQYYFIPLLIYFYKSLGIKELLSYIKYISQYEEGRFDDKEIDTAFDSAKRLLYKDKIIAKKISQNNEEIRLELSSIGYKEVCRILYNTNIHFKNKLYDKIRFDIMKRDYY
ncbi:retron St85 family effector protein [Caloranaerobacter sp. DY30410]|uniref:retron St85 family effector protein n=1 Tax=Caloranaerobacter sp. DY30410 TaxID=3238305 RepID=UPI003D004A75